MIDFPMIGHHFAFLVPNNGINKIKVITNHWWKACVLLYSILSFLFIWIHSWNSENNVLFPFMEDTHQHILCTFCRMKQLVERIITDYAQRQSLKAIIWYWRCWSLKSDQDLSSSFILGGNVTTLMIQLPYWLKYTYCTENLWDQKEIMFYYV